MKKNKNKKLTKKQLIEQQQRQLEKKKRNPSKAKKQEVRQKLKKEKKAIAKAKKIKQIEVVERSKNKYIYRKGTINQKIVNKLQLEHPDKLGKISDVKKLEQIIKSYAQRSGKSTISVERAWASYTGDKLGGMLANTGYTLEELAEQTNSTPDELLDESRWSNNWTTFINSQGEEYEFEFDNYQTGIVFSLMGAIA